MLCVLLPTAQTSAQIAIPGALTLTSAPSYPEIGEHYTLTLSTYDLPAPISSIQWLVNGTEATNSQDKTSIELVAGNVSTAVKTRVTLSNGAVLEETYSLSPYRVDLLISADTTVPAFYAGRPLPSSGSTILAKAIIFYNGVQVGDSYSYIWKVNGKVQSGGAQYSNNDLSFKTNFEDKVTLSVDVYNSNGVVVAHESKIIPIAEPELYFYERNPLRGLSTQAMLDPHLFIGEEMSVRGEAYFMDKDLFTQDGFTEWKIDGKKVEPSSADGQEVTIRKEKNTGSSRLTFHMRNMRELLQGIEDTITIRF